MAYRLTCYLSRDFLELVCGAVNNSLQQRVLLDAVLANPESEAVALSVCMVLYMLESVPGTQNLKCQPKIVAKLKHESNRCIFLHALRTMKA